MRRSLPFSLAAAATTFVLPATSHAQSSPRVELALEVDPCVQVDAHFARRIIDIELGTATPPPDAGASVRARVTCAGSMQLLRIDDAVTGKALERTIDLHGADPAARTRLLALAVAELVAASWAELEVTPAPSVQPVPPPAPREVQESAREALRERAESAADDAPPARRERRAPSPPPLSGLDGSIGLLHVATAEMPRRAAVRGTFAVTYAPRPILGPTPGYEVISASRILFETSVAASLLRNLEIFAGLQWSYLAETALVTRTPSSAPVAVTDSRVVVNGLRIGASGAFAPTRWISLGATAALLPRLAFGTSSTVVSALFRTQATLDFSSFSSWVPLRLHANLGYRLDNSARSVAALEQLQREHTAFYDASVCDRPPSTDPTDPRNVGATGLACNAQIDANARYALDINRVDRVDVAVAIDLWIPSFPYVRPFVEYSTFVPIARSNYVCFDAPLSSVDVDRCLASTNLAGNPVPSQVTIGTRATLPFAANLSALVAVDIATGGTSTFVRELAPTTPWTLHFALAVAPEFGPLPGRAARAPAPAAQAAEPPR